MSLVKLCGIKNLSDVFICLNEDENETGVPVFDKINNFLKTDKENHLH